MSRALLKLECFENEVHSDGDEAIAPQEVETLRTRAYEDGYGAGWADALEHFRNEDALRRAASEDALQAAAFGYHEARAELEACFIQLANDLLTKLVPHLRATALRAHVETELRALAARHLGDRLEVLCAPSSMSDMSELVGQSNGATITLIEEPSFTEAQVAIRVGQHLRQIDLDALQAALNAALGESSKDKDKAYG